MPPACPVVRDVGCYSRRLLSRLRTPMARPLPKAAAGQWGGSYFGSVVCSSQRETPPGKPVASFQTSWTLRNKNRPNNFQRFTTIHPDFAHARVGQARAASAGPPTAAIGDPRVSRKDGRSLYGAAERPKRRYHAELLTLAGAVTARFAQTAAAHRRRPRRLATTCTCR